MTAIDITANTWLLKTCDQYDYLSSFKRTTSSSIEDSAVIYQQGNEVVVKRVGERSEGRVVAILVVVKGLAALISPEILGLSEKLWLVIRSIQKQSSLGYKLSEGDIVRLGLSKWGISEIHSANIQHSTAPISLFSLMGGNEGEVRQCKICLSGEDEPTNQLIAPCLCKGSVQYVHVDCLESWIGSQRCGHESDYNNKYIWKQAICSVCKATLPMDLETRAGIIHNLGVPKPKNEDYIGLRNMNSQAHEVHIWRWRGHNTLTVGSGPCNKVWLPDEGLSDEHAIVRSKNGDVYLQDHGSQFGTLVQVRKALVLNPGQKVSVQSGNTVLSFELKEKRQLFRYFSASHARSSTIQELTTEISEIVKLFSRSMKS